MVKDLKDGEDFSSNHFSKANFNRSATVHAAKGGFIAGAVKHPGRLQAMAKREGISTLQAAEKASHSSDPSLRAAGNLGKRFIKGDLSHKRKG